MKLRQHRKSKQRQARPLVINRLENVSKDVFKQYYPLITELVAAHLPCDQPLAGGISAL